MQSQEDKDLDNPLTDEVVSATTKRRIKKSAIAKKSKPWTPPNRLDVDKRDPNYEYAWVNHTEKQMFRNAMAKGWEVVQDGAKEKAAERHSNDPHGLSSAVTTGSDLVLCRMPKDRHKEMRKYYDDLAKNQMSLVRSSNVEGGLGGHFKSTTKIEETTHRR